MGLKRVERLIEPFIGFLFLNILGTLGTNYLWKGFDLTVVFQVLNMLGVIGN